MPLNTSKSWICTEPDGSVVGHWAPFTLRTAYQPIYALESGRLRLAAFEGLVRPMRDGHEIAPTVLFNAANAIDRLRIEALAREIHIINASVFAQGEQSLFINFDPSLFCDRAIVRTALGQIRDAVNAVGLPAHRIVCEITEQSTGSAVALQDFVHAIRQEGYRLAVDDYGADSSDIERVKELHPDIVKFDARWIVRLMQSRPGVALLTVMVEEFAAQGVSTVFEGIEEHWQIEVAAEIGASMMQGYALARPALAGDLRGRIDALGIVGSIVSSAGTSAVPVSDRLAGRPGNDRRRVFGRRGS